jgi:hypothetical protein
MFALFPLGQVVATPGALAAIERAKQPASCFLARHAIGDWGVLEPADVAENEYSVAHGFRLLSSYIPDRYWGEAMDNHRSGPVCNHSAFARGVLNSCTKDNQSAKALLTGTSSVFRHSGPACYYQRRRP